MNVQQRDFYRLNILKKLCEVTDYNISIQIGQTKKICDLYNVETEEEFSTLLGAINYLTQKGYITSKIITMMGGNTQIFMIQLTALGLDMIESIERKTSTEKYENDFSREAIISLSNINNSTVIINSPNVTLNISILVTFLFIFIGIIFDIIGTSLLTASEASFHSMASNKVMGDEVNEIDKKLIISWINEFAGGNILATISGLMEVFGMVEGIVSYSLFIEHISSAK